MAPPRKYMLNEAYFDEVDSPEKAYWLGFIAADGYVRRNRYLEVKLTETDKPHLRKLASALGTDQPFYYMPAHGYSKPAVRLAVNSAHIARALESLGITQAKSFTVQPWYGPDKLMPYYWRGLFDGDGSIGCYSSEWQIEIVGSLYCVQGFADWAKNMCLSTAGCRSRGKLWIWRVHGNQKVQLLAQALTLKESFSLERKQFLLESAQTG